MFLTIAAVEVALHVVALLVALAIHEHFFAVNFGCAIAPRDDTERTFATVKIARLGVALLVAFIIARLDGALTFVAFGFLQFEIVVGLQSVRLQRLTHIGLVLLGAKIGGLKL